MQRIKDQWGATITEACRYSSVPPEFLAALIANESAGISDATRFEPRVYRYLRAVVKGERRRFGEIFHRDIDAEVAEMAKSPEYHCAKLDERFVRVYGGRLLDFEDAALRDLATSFGLTQVMGYHMISRPGTPRALLEPIVNLKISLGLLAEFAEHYGLNLTLEFPELLRCFNTGGPYGTTFDPKYVENGLGRMQIYRELNRRDAENAESCSAPPR